MAIMSNFPGGLVALAVDTAPTEGSSNLITSGGVKTALNGVDNTIAGVNARINDLHCDGAGAHNSIYRGKNIQDKYNDGSLYTAITSGTFEDLYIGDYFDITISSSYKSNELVRCVLAGFDVYRNNGDSALTAHHAVIVPFNAFATTAQMNSENVTTGGYKNCAMHTTVIAEYARALTNVFNSHLLTSRELLSNAINTSTPSMAGSGWTGASSGWEWVDCKLRLMSEVEVYGSTVFSSSFYDVGNAKTQLPLFRLRPDRIVCGLGGTDGNARYAWWLSAVAGATSFALVYSDGDADYASASYSLGFRPRFLIA